MSPQSHPWRLLASALGLSLLGAGCSRELHDRVSGPVSTPFDRACPGVCGMSRHFADRVRPQRAAPAPVDPCADESDPEESDGATACHALLPPEWLEFTGVIAGLEYRTGEAAIQRAPPILARIAAALHARPRLRLVIVGHADEREAPELSRRRAERVQAELIAHGAPATQLELRAVGADEPSGLGPAHDRRVELAPRLDHEPP